MDHFNNWLAILVLMAIAALWLCTGLGLVHLPGEILGALIATWTLVIQFYFRKRSGGANAVGNEVAIALVVIVIGQFCALWYKLGRVENRVDQHCRQHGRDKLLRD